ncbi:MAG: hypothetical protein NTY64_07040, partial [Deltaproteobacteria bacterium]|nr:hypothetical protein [Deltaproteobacteria bacterium]
FFHHSAPLRPGHDPVSGRFLFDEQAWSGRGEPPWPKYAFQKLRVGIAFLTFADTVLSIRDKIYSTEKGEDVPPSKGLAKNSGRFPTVIAAY